MVLLHFEIRNSVAKQAANSVVFLEHGYGVASPGQLLSSGETSWARTDNSNCLSGQSLGCVRNNQVVFERAIDNRNFDLFNCDSWLVDSKNTRALARCWAQPARELRKIIGCVQAVDGCRTLIAPG